MRHGAESGSQAQMLRSSPESGAFQGGRTAASGLTSRPPTIGDLLTTQTRSHAPNLVHPALDGNTEPSQATRYAAAGRYTDVETLTHGKTRHAVRPGRYTDVDTIARPKSDAAVRPGSYIDVDALSGRVPAPGRPGSYTDADCGGR